MIIILQFILNLLIGVVVGVISQRLHIIFKPGTSTVGLFILKPTIAVALLSLFYHNVFILQLCLCLGICFGISLQPVGLTGGIACGKSSVAKRLKSNTDCAVIDVDAIAHSILDSDTGEAYSMIVKEFGKYDIFEGNTKKIHRRKLGEVIFPDPEKRRKLNSITHPIITRIMIKEMILKKCWSRYPIVVVDIPLLFEGRLQWLFGLIIVVACSPDVQLKRLSTRNSDLTEQQCRDRISSQIPISKKVEQAHFVIHNNGTEEGLDENVRLTIRKVQNLYGQFSLLHWISLGRVLMMFFENFAPFPTSQP